MSQTMRAVDVKDGAGPPSSLFITTTAPKPTPKPSECLVRISHFGLNRADTLQREGKYPVPPGVTKIMGLEFSGVVEEVGDDDHHRDWKVGDAVLGLTYGGAYAEYVAVQKSMLIHKPAELGWEVCGGLCEVWFTALQTLYLVGGLDPKTTRSVLFHAGASSVSIAGIQLARAESPAPKVFITARQDAKISFCVDKVGATAGVNTTTAPKGDWAGEIRKLNDDKGVDLLVDYVGASYFQQNLDVMNLDGRIVQLGTMGGTNLEGQGKDGGGVDISAFVRKRVRFEGSTLRSRDPEYQGRLRDLFVEKVLPHLVNGTFENHVDTVMSWKEIGKAHEMLEQNKTMGKIVCKVD